jgi:hypothetical protein
VAVSAAYNPVLDKPPDGPMDFAVCSRRVSGPEQRERHGAKERSTSLDGANGAMRETVERLYLHSLLR